MAWPETAALAGRAGYDAVDVDLRELDAFGAPAVLEQLAAAGVVAGIAQFPVEFRFEEARFEQQVGDLPRLARLAAEVGVTTVYRSVPASSDLPRAEMEAVLARRLARCLPVLRDNRLRLAIEVLGPLHFRREAPHGFLWRLPDAVAFADRLGPDVGVLADAWHWHHAGEGADAIVDAGDRILHVHIADAPDAPPEAIRDDERLLPGEGVLDFGGFFGALRAAGYDGLVTPEVWGYRCDAPEPLDCARRARVAAAGVLAR